MAQQLIDSLSSDFEPSKYHDEYREKVLELIERKAAGEEIAVQPTAEEPQKVPDLMAALEASLAAVKDPEAGESKSDGKSDGRRKPSPRATARSRPRAPRPARRSNSGPIREDSPHVSPAAPCRLLVPWPDPPQGTGKGFTYLDADGERVTEPEDIERIAELGIPPAWKDVWICPDSRGHLQATGIDAAGRKQYLYHPQWRTRRDSEKFDEMIALRRARCRSCASTSTGDLDGHRRADPRPRAGLRGAAARPRLLPHRLRAVHGRERVLRPRHHAQGARHARPRAARDGVRLRGQERQAPDPGRGRPGRLRGRRRAQAPPRRRARAARLQERPLVVRRPLAGHQRVPQGGHRRRLLGQGLPHLGGDDAGGDRARGLRRGGGHQDRAQARRRRARSRRSRTTSATRPRSAARPTSIRA